MTIALECASEHVSNIVLIIDDQYSHDELVSSMPSASTKTRSNLPAPAQPFRRCGRSRASLELNRTGSRNAEMSLQLTKKCSSGDRCGGHTSCGATVIE